MAHATRRPLQHVMEDESAKSYSGLCPKNGCFAPIIATLESTRLSSSRTTSMKNTGGGSAGREIISKFWAHAWHTDVGKERAWHGSRLMGCQSLTGICGSSSYSLHRESGLYPHVCAILLCCSSAYSTSVIRFLQPASAAEPAPF